MNTFHFKTDLSCESCVEKLKPILNGEKAIDFWAVDLSSPDKILTVRGDQVTKHMIANLIGKEDYHILGNTEDPPSFLKTYFPLLLIFSYLSGFTLLKQYGLGVFNSHEAMIDFMGGFFVVFSFFKMLNLSGFAEAYSTYDVIAKRFRAYGFIYPFLELSLGIAYLIRFDPRVTNISTIVLMTVSSIGVIQAVSKKSKIQCACLGTIFNLPMTYITLFEDLLMVVMASMIII